MNEDETIADEMVRLRQEVRVLRESLDELTTCLQWAFLNSSMFDANNGHSQSPDPPKTDPARANTIEKAETTTLDPAPGSLF